MSSLSADPAGRQIALLMPDAYVPAHRYFTPYLTPGGDDMWKGVRFVVNPTEGVFDGLVVHQSMRELDREYLLQCPPTRTLLALKEPPELLFLPDGYTQQFYATLGQDSRVRCRRNFLEQSGHHWFVERTLHEARHTPFTAKPKLLSAVVSAKTDTEGHRRRLRLMEALQQHFGARLDWFGRGVREIGNHKLTGLADYQYHIVLENGAWPHYWTEKLADAYVANCVPIYWGAPNIDQYFDPASMLRIDLDNHAGTIAQIEAALAADLHARIQPLLAAERAKVLDRYHPYQTYLNLFSRLPASEPAEVKVRPHPVFSYSLPARLRLRLWNWQHAPKPSKVGRRPKLSLASQEG